MPSGPLSRMPWGPGPERQKPSGSGFPPSTWVVWATLPSRQTPYLTVDWAIGANVSQPFSTPPRASEPEASATGHLAHPPLQVASCNPLLRKVLTSTRHLANLATRTRKDTSTAERDRGVRRRGRSLLTPCYPPRVRRSQPKPHGMLRPSAGSSQRGGEQAEGVARRRGVLPDGPARHLSELVQ